MKYTRQDCRRVSISICCLLFITFLLIICSPADASASATATRNYSVTAATQPRNTHYIKYSTYSKYTRQYYMLRSYLEQLEKDGGGTLTLSAGTYAISNTLYIPSNVAIYFENGVVIKKIAKTGVTGFKSSKSIFQLASPSKSAVKSAYSGYHGEKNISLIGKGSVIFDLNFDTDCLGIMMGHNKDVCISGITFQNMKSGHFIELDASQNVTIENNRFMHHKASETGIKEAINIDTPDKSTGGFHAVWTSYDCTPDQDILIQNNNFEDLERAIGTHKYSEGKYHENVQILKNKITNTDSDAIRVLNWTNPVIKGNEIDTVDGGKGNKRAILASGVSNPSITDNTFINVSRPIQIMPWKNTGTGSQYAITYNDVSKDNISSMLNNTLISVQERFIRINDRYNDYSSHTEKYYFSDNYDQ